ncbi:hypothetical protein SY2F82_29260 [Streptomyces sp. Y2F8-2]|nr:hypothetical protein SY2F82_29260 [Streptomyces sp. Y2F8-2]
MRAFLSSIAHDVHSDLHITVQLHNTVQGTALHSGVQMEEVEALWRRTDTTRGRAQWQP